MLWRGMAFWRGACIVWRGACNVLEGRGILEGACSVLGCVAYWRVWHLVKGLNVRDYLSVSSMYRTFKNDNLYISRVNSCVQFVPTSQFHDSVQ